MASTIRKYFYDVFIQLGTLSLAVKFPCKVGTIWQSFMKSLQADSKPDLIQGTSYLQDTITDSTVMEFNTANNTFSPKKSTIKILLYTEKGVREAGQVDFDLASVLNNRQTEMTMELRLEKCPDKKAKISFTVRMILKEEVRNQVSYAAGFVSDITFGNTNQIPQQKSSPHLPPLPPSHQHQHLLQHQMTQITPSEMVSTNNRPAQPLTPPNIEIKISPPVVAAPPEPIEDYKLERDALLDENTQLCSLLKQSEDNNQHLRSQLMVSLSEKETLHSELESRNLHITNLQAQNEELLKIEEMYKEAEEQLMIARTQLARIFNASTELGGLLLTDKLQTAIGIQENQPQTQQNPEQVYHANYSQIYQEQEL